MEEDIVKAIHMKAIIELRYEDYKPRLVCPLVYGEMKKGRRLLCIKVNSLQESEPPSATDFRLYDLDKVQEVQLTSVGFSMPWNRDTLKKDFEHILAMVA